MTVLQEVSNLINSSVEDLQYIKKMIAIEAQKNGVEK